MAELKEQKGSGKRNNHKMKPYYVYDYLMRETDAMHVASAKMISAHLLENYGIQSEIRSIYKDIEEINIAMLMTLRDAYGEPKVSSFEKAKALLADDKNKTVIYDPHRKGFYVRRRHYKLDDIRILAECIYAAKFIDEKRAKRLVNVVCDLTSEHNAKTIRRDALLLDRVKTENVAIYESVNLISAAMSRTRGKKIHTPEKIKFKYLSYTLQGNMKRTERRKGEWYVVSPYKLLISDGNYYLMGYDDKTHKIMNYRVDRMKDVELTGEERSGEEDFKALNIEAYLQEHFGMYQGEREHVKIRALNMLLDTFVDRFGTRDVIYAKDDDKHFTAIVNVAVSNQFFGWLCGLGKKVQIISPIKVRKQFIEYIDNIREKY